MDLRITWGSLWRIFGMVVFATLIFISRDVFVAFILAVVIAAALDPAVSWMQRRRIPRILGTLAVYIIAILLVAIVLYVILPVFLTELNTVLENSKDVFGSLTDSLGIQPTVLQTITSALNQFTNSLLGGRTTLVSVLSRLLGGLLLAVIVFVISFYLTLGRDGVERFLRALLPPRFHSTAVATYQRVHVKISYWFTGQIFLSLLIGVAVYIGLLILGVPYAFILGVAAAAFELVPYVGPIFAGSLAVLTALSQSPTLALYTLLLFIAIQQIESHVLIPAVNRYTTNLNPVIVIMSLLVGGKILGLAGIILAVPLAVLFQEILRNWNVGREPVIENDNL